VSVRSDIYAMLRPPAATLSSELCSCPLGTPVKLMSAGGIGFNPLHCLNCNLEVAPERLGLSAQLAWDVANWLLTYGAIDALELQAGEYQHWARGVLLDPASPANSEGFAVTRRLNELVRCYFWFWQAEGDDDWEPRSTCPICARPLERYDAGISPQLLCEDDNLSLVGS
jgi:hypothetical protein